MNEEKCKLKITLVTGRAANHIVREIVSGDRCVRVVTLPINVMSLIDVFKLKKIIETNPDIKKLLEDSDLVIIPGLVRGDASVISEIIGRPVYKGTKSVVGIPYILEHLRRGEKLDSRLPADDILSRPLTRISFKEAFKIRRLSVPFRGPPILVMSEIPPQIDPDVVGVVAKELVKEGTDIVLVGSYEKWYVDKIKRRLELIRKALGHEVVIGAEIPNLHALKRVRELNLDLVYLPATIIKKGENLIDLSDETVVIADRDINVVKDVINLMDSIGINKILIDPVLDLPLLGLVDSLIRYKEFLKIEKPLVFSAANVVEEIEADTHGAHALLATIATELRVSLYTVVFDTYKSIHEVAEAKEALRLSSEAWSRGVTERGLYSRLLIVKQSIPPPPPRLPPGERIIESRPVLDKAGYFVIDVDHKRNVIIVEFRGVKGSFRLESSNGLMLAREAVRRANVIKEHAAYLGYELNKAELALRLGRTYSQDEPVLEVPWRNEDR